MQTILVKDISKLYHQGIEDKKKNIVKEINGKIVSLAEEGYYEFTYKCYHTQKLCREISQLYRKQGFMVDFHFNHLFKDRYNTYTINIKWDDLKDKN
jgi:hypothetical protein